MKRSSKLSEIVLRMSATEHNAKNLCNPRFLVQSALVLTAARDAMSNCAAATMRNITRIEGDVGLRPKKVVFDSEDHFPNVR
jgi:hypothetical protein